MSVWNVADVSFDAAQDVCPHKNHHGHAEAMAMPPRYSSCDDSTCNFVVMAAPVTTAPGYRKSAQLLPVRGGRLQTGNAIIHLGRRQNTAVGG